MKSPKSGISSNLAERRPVKWYMKPPKMNVKPSAQKVYKASLLNAKNAYENSIEEEINTIKKVFANKMVKALNSKVSSFKFAEKTVDDSSTKSKNTTRNKDKSVSGSTVAKDNVGGDTFGERVLNLITAQAQVDDSEHQKFYPRDVNISITTGNLSNGCNINVSN